ncbi:MAG: hypothetical protein R3B09_21715 [Nannocystaceae bacterium]
MARPNYSAGKRQRTIDKERKRAEKAERRRQHRAQGGASIQITTAAEIQGGIMRGEMDDGPDEPAEGGRRHSIPSRLFVGGLSSSMSSADLRALFDAFGPIEDAVVVMDRDLGESRGFGFVTMADRRDAAIATRELSGREIDGRTLVVRPATERSR